jgi:hypothetical protein
VGAWSSVRAAIRRLIDGGEGGGDESNDAVQGVVVPVPGMPPNSTLPADASASS